MGDLVLIFIVLCEAKITFGAFVSFRRQVSFHFGVSVLPVTEACKWHYVYLIDVQVVRATLRISDHKKMSVSYNTNQ